MKSVLILTALIGAAVSPATAAPRLHLNTTDIQPETEIDLILDKPVISNDQVGKTTPNNLLTSDPKLEGDLVWKAPNIARFVPKDAPRIGTSYSFSITP